MKYLKQSKNNTQAGFAATPIVIAISAIVIALSVSLSLGSVVEVNLSSGNKDKTINFHNADAGINDALMKIARDSEYSSAGYSLPVPSGNVTISVSNDTPSPNQSTIISSSTYNNKTTELQAIATLDSDGAITSVDWQQN